MTRYVTFICAILALACALAIALAGPGAQLQLWGWADGFTIMRKVSTPIPVLGIGISPIITAAVLAAAFGVLALVKKHKKLGVAAIVCAATAFAAVQVPMRISAAANSHPFIHDITTDFISPPPIIIGAAEERSNPAEYVGDEIAPKSDKTIKQAQQEAYPDVTTRRYSLPKDTVIASVNTALNAMDIRILASGDHDESYLIQGIHTSTWYGFIDDFIVRVSVDDQQVLVDVRSKSRVGTSDLGANAKRIRTLFQLLDDMHSS
jgi:uncharacterized protein (DUF1499 family)